MKKREARRAAAGGLERGAVGLEAEFVVLVDGEPEDPKSCFRDPRAFLPAESLHRVGSSYHLATGGAVYFDTGVIEVVTPLVEVDRGAPWQVVRSLWEGICDVRAGLDGWSRSDGRSTRLVGFSAHYNVSLPGFGGVAELSRMARALLDLLAFPVMLFATNRRSTGVGVRPRPGRIEVTVDFTPDPALMAATAAVIVAAVQEVAGWARHDRAELERRGFPVLVGVTPIPHTSRKGWLLQASCFERDPFATHPDARVWRTTGGATLSTRGVARRTVARLRPRIRAVAAPDTVRLMEALLDRRHPSLLDLDDRPAPYEDVGRACLWEEQDPARPLPRSLYEQAMRDAATGRPLDVSGQRWLPVAVEGWTRVLYRDAAGRRRLFSVDELVRLRPGPRRAPGP